MALQPDITSPEDVADAEVEIRKAICEMFLEKATPYGFDANHAHTRKRYVDSDEKWVEIAMVVDPDTSTQPNSRKTIIMRLFAVELTGYTRALTEITFRYSIVISFGFKDEYASDPTRNTSDELTRCAILFAEHLYNNLNLGLDDRVTNTYLTINGRTFVAADTQGRPAQKFDCSLSVILGVC